ncbi:MAG TPA: AarF/UbiB family protein [Miltoncostaeaceae bacterium]|nr:AarF/UbiB family protein [Miltoncostaeaceae bacterium]
MARGERRQNLARIGEIARVAARHGFGYAFGRKNAPGVDGTRSTRGRRVREALEELGPTFVKFGQILATRPDLVPADVIEELRALQDDVRTEPFEAIRAVLEEELGLTLERAYVEFDPRPLAAASIGQVHRAILPGGHDVVVKVQRPDAQRRIEADLQLMYQAARIAADNVRRLRPFDPVGMVDQFARTIRRELDYRVEASNAETIARQFAGDDRVVVPHIHWRQTTARVLTMQRAEGTPLGRLTMDDWSPEQRRTLAHLITETWMKMVFSHGFFHADPHPANILVAAPNRLALVDFGMTERLSQRDREGLVRLLLDVLESESESLPRRLRAMGMRYPRQLEPDLEEQLALIMQRYSNEALGDIDARAVIGEIFQTIYRLDISLPPRFVMLDKTIATLSGVALAIDPEMNVFDVARPLAVRMAAARYRPDRIADRARVDAGRYASALREYPFQVGELLDQFTDGSFELTVHTSAVEQAADKLQAATNRLALAIVAAALLLGSTVLAVFARGDRFIGLAWVAFPGVLGALVLIAWLAIGIGRSRRW